MIQTGDADAVVTGGSEAALTPLATAAFAALDALSEEGISRPFDALRDGFVMGEGGAVLILEDGEKARARRHDPRPDRGLRRELDAHHLTAPRPDGAGAVQAMKRALEDAGYGPQDVVYVNAHGTSTPLNDRAETVAIKDVLGNDVSVSSLKSLDRAPARRRRRRGGRRNAAGDARPGRPADAQLRAARRGARPRLRAQRGTHARRQRPPRRRSRTRSASAATTPSCAWRPFDSPARSDHGQAESDRAPRGALRPRLADAPAQRRPVASYGEKSRPGDGVIAGAGRVDGRPVFCYAQDPSYLGGSLGEQHADSIVRVLRLAGRAGAPVVGFIESGGARMQEGLAALAGYARIFQEHVRLSGKIPQISVICGASAGGAPTRRP